MNQKETIGEFHQRHGRESIGTSPFYVYRTEDFAKTVTLPDSYRSFYKITLAWQSKGVLSYADKDILINDNVLFFGNPMIPYSWTRGSGIETGYFCLFTEDFIGNRLNGTSLSKSPLFKVSGNHVLHLTQESMKHIEGIFLLMLKEAETTYKNKIELFRNYVEIIIHEGLKIAPSPQFYVCSNNGKRVTELFFELLNRQFPITSTRQIILLKNAGEYAMQLSIHTNYLNRVLKEITGRTTTEHIADRMIVEAKSLLTHMNWDISEIAYCLGFEHAPSFNLFFKKHTGHTPGQVRERRDSIS